MPYPQYKDAGALTRSVATVNAAAAGTNADPDVNRTGSLDGDNVTVGAVADAASTAGGAGTVGAKLRLVTSQLATVAQDGADATGVAPPAGAVGIRGWLSTIADRVASVLARVPVLGQAVAGASVPVVLPAAQVAALTPFSTVTIGGSVATTGAFFQATQPVSALALPLPAGASTEATLAALSAKVTAVNTGAVVISGPLPAGANAIGGVTVSNFPATQPVSNASLPLPTGASTEATLAALSAKVPAQGQALAAASVPVVLTASQMTALTPVAGLTDAQLRATAVPVASALQAGTAVVGKVGIDQTTPGITNGVAVLAQVGAANLANGQVTVGTTVGGDVVAAARATRRTLTVVNHGTTAVYLGSGTVSATNGVLLAGVVGASATFGVTGAVKAIVASGTQVVSFSEEFD